MRLCIIGGQWGHRRFRIIESLNNCFSIKGVSYVQVGACDRLGTFQFNGSCRRRRRVGFEKAQDASVLTESHEFLV